MSRVLFHTARRRVEIRPVPSPRPGPGEVVVRSICSGISGGTERLVCRWGVPSDTAPGDTIEALPGTLGYPFSHGYACVHRVAGQARLAFA